MKNIFYLFLICVLGLSSCGKTDNLASFSKRKYLKKAPKQKAPKQKAIEQVILPELEVCASTDITPETNTLEKGPESDLEMVQQYRPVKLNNVLANAFEPSIDHSMHLSDKVGMHRNKRKISFNEGEPLWFILVGLLIIAISFGVILCFAVVLEVTLTSEALRIILYISLVAAAIWSAFLLHEYTY